MTPQPARAFDVYDSFGIGPFPQPDRDHPPPLRAEGGYVRIFGNANVGNQRLCNLQCPGQLLHGPGVSRIGHWYATTDAPTDLTDAQQAALLRVTTTTTVTLAVGDRITWREPLVALLQRCAWPGPGDDDERTWFQRYTTRHADVPYRQAVSVEISAFGGQVQRLMDQMGERPIGFWIHLQGIQILEVPA